MGSDPVTLVANSVYRHEQSIQQNQHLEAAYMCSWLELCRWNNYNSHTIRNNFFTDEAHFNRDGVKNIRNSQIWDRNNPHGTVESKHQHSFSVKGWCGDNGQQNDGSVHFSATSDRLYLRQLLQDELPTLLENVPLQTRREICYQNDGAPSHFSQVVRQNHKSLIDGLIVAVYRIGYHGHRSRTL